MDDYTVNLLKACVTIMGSQLCRLKTLRKLVTIHVNDDDDENNMLFI